MSRIRMTIAAVLLALLATAPSTASANVELTYTNKGLIWVWLT